MNKLVTIPKKISLDDYACIAHLMHAATQLRNEAPVLTQPLRGRTVWMINSTEKGGGVAEMLPRVVSMLRELGVSCEWAVMQTDVQAFFTLTKRLHNLIHGAGDPSLCNEDREVYEAVNRACAEHLKTLVKPEDIVVIHDPQPCGAGAFLKATLGVRTIWRCHIGLDERTDATRAAWRFLQPYAATFDHGVFSAPEYIPDFLTGRSTLIFPALDPLSQKNRELSPHKLMGVLCDAQLALPHQPVLTPPFDTPAMRLQPNGKWAIATQPEECGLLYRPMVLQVSRWDRLKGYAPLLNGFCELKGMLNERNNKMDDRQRHRVEILRLVLAGPDPASIQDDPEGQQVLEELRQLYMDLLPGLQRDVMLVTLPMQSRKINALMVNALQRCAVVVAQNSFREGFGLTATEAMWKRKPVLASRKACGLRHQVRDGLDGRLVADPEDTRAIAETLNEMLADPHMQEAWGENAQRHVHDEFLVFAQVANWLRTLCDCAQIPPRSHD